MKYHIDTIPVWDALKAGGGCLLCRLSAKAERLLLSRALGGSVMSPDSRLTVNRRGFCASHHRMLYEEKHGNRLGHALMTLSHLQELRPKVTGALRDSKPGVNGGRGLQLFARNAREERSVSSHGLKRLAEGCALCDDLRHQEDGHLASLLHLWKTDKSFRDAFGASTGLCVPHTADVIHAAPKTLSGDILNDLADTAGKLLEENLGKLENDLDRFTRKFDYRNADMPWNGAKDALERAVHALRGRGLDNGFFDDERT